MKKRLFLSPPHMSGAELGLLHEAFESNYIAPLGPMVDAFEKEFSIYTGIPHCLALASGTAAMHLALREVGVGPGDEVLASSLTFIGSVTPATFLGASVTFIDSEAKSWNMDPNLLEEELKESARRGKLPKAVIPTDIYGQCCDLPRILEICAPYQIPIVCDSAEAMGAFYQPLIQGIAGLGDRKIGDGKNRKPKTETGKIDARIPRPAHVGDTFRHDHQVRSKASSNNGLPAFNSRPAISAQLRHAGCGAKAAVYSFNGNKILTTSGGGMLASEDGGLIEHARKLSQQARDPFPYYEHSEIGYNYRMSNLLAAVGRGQLQVLDERVAAKRRIFDSYQQLLGDLPGLTFMSEVPTGRCNRWLTVILIDETAFGETPEEVRLALEAENIESRPVWKPMHLQPVFRNARVRGGAVSERLFRHGLCLPSGTAMTPEDLERVADAVRKCAVRKNFQSKSRMGRTSTICAIAGAALSRKPSCNRGNR